ncbi:pentapeptide repeat-containing protein [uncultured Nostoc sp.]|uniref:pentapeptide repeat-containing protein n=1 Tax=uncultured Nostoc sp. TaxID=340711 RepID=UPI0035CC663B
MRSPGLSGTFIHANFRGCNFQKAILRNFNSEGADFSDADLRGLQLLLFSCHCLNPRYFHTKNGRAINTLPFYNFLFEI